MANVDVVKKVVAAFGSLDLSAAETGEPPLDLERFDVAGFATADFSCSFIAGPDGPRSEWEGLEGLLAGWTDWAGAFESYRLEPDGEPLAHGDVVVNFTRQTATGRGSGTPIHNEAAGVWFFRDGRVARIEFHLDRDEALRSAGLDPADVARRPDAERSQ